MLKEETLNTTRKLLPFGFFYADNMTELIKVNTNEQGSKVVSARELYDFLEVKTDFSKWCSRMFEYGFEENKDYSLVKIGERSAHNKIDYALTLDTSKEIAMIQRSKKGKQARQYFIECEKVVEQIKFTNNAISQIEQHTYRPVQIQSAKAANHYAFTKQNGKEDAIAWHRKNCFYFTGKTPYELKEWAKNNNVPSKDRTSGKEIIRKFRPDKAAGVSIADFIHSMGEPDDVALKIGEQAMPVVNMLMKYQDKQINK